jgi:hypothetical protein
MKPQLLLLSGLLTAMSQLCLAQPSPDRLERIHSGQGKFPSVEAYLAFLLSKAADPKEDARRVNTQIKFILFRCNLTEREEPLIREKLSAIRAFRSNSLEPLIRGGAHHSAISPVIAESDRIANAGALEIMRRIDPETFAFLRRLATTP